MCILPVFYNNIIFYILIISYIYDLSKVIYFADFGSFPNVYKQMYSIDIFL